MYQKIEAICEEVDKDHTLLMQETTKYVENQMSAAGTNVQKFFADFMEDILPPAPEVDIKCLSLKRSVDSTEDCNLLEQSEPDKESIQTKNSQYPEPPLLHHEALFETTASGIEGLAGQEGMGGLDNACKMQLGGSLSSRDRYIREKRTMEENFEETVTVKLDNLNGDAERFLSVVELSVANTPSFSKEGDLKECLSVEINENEQTAYWYEKEYAQTRDGIDESFCNLFVDVAVANECPSAEISDSDWEVL